MKKTPLVLLCSLTFVGCTYYPKNYTYSPAVSIGGSNEGNLVLPSPFSKKSPKTISTAVEKTYISRQPEPELMPMHSYNPYNSYNPAAETTVVFVGQMQQH